MENEKITKLENQVYELTNMLESFKRDYEKHQHDDLDGTKILTKDIKIGMENYLDVGYAGHGTAKIQNLGATNEQMQYAISVSKDNRRGFVNKIPEFAQLSILHQPNSPTKQSFFVGARGPYVSQNSGQTIDTTSGGNTVTISGFNFVTNELAGALISIKNSSGDLVETRVIASNTDTVITISGTWGASTSGGTFEINVPMYNGASSYIWQRLYTQEGTGGGIRFGMGKTVVPYTAYDSGTTYLTGVYVSSGGKVYQSLQDSNINHNPSSSPAWWSEYYFTTTFQNGLLYMDATGDLYWRNKSGTSTKLN